MPAQQADERTRLLGHNQPNNGRNEQTSDHQQDGSPSQGGNDREDVEIVDFEKDDNENPRNWPLFWKYTQVLLVFSIGLLLPMTSSIFAPGVDEIASDYGTNNQFVMGGQTGFVVMLGIVETYTLYAMSDGEFNRYRTTLLCAHVRDFRKTNCLSNQHDAVHACSDSDCPGAECTNVHSDEDIKWPIRKRRGRERWREHLRHV